MTRAFEYIDGGRSQAVRQSLEGVLRGIRGELGADVALAIHQENTQTSRVSVLASSGSLDLDLPLPNELMFLSPGFRMARPASGHDLLLCSAVRSFELEIASALMIPWIHAGGRGWLVVGMTPGAWNGGTLDITTASNYADKLRETHLIAGLRGSTRLRQDIIRSARRIAEAEISARSVEDFLHSVVVAARELLGTSACYAALPTDDGLTFKFSTLLDVRTSEFRRLRMGPGQGLGGLAREELRAVRSMNYAKDFRPHDAPVHETLNEGFLSAMCVPLMAEGRLIGLLYAANRRLTPFTETDGALLEEFAGYATLGLKHAQVEEHRDVVMRRLERERLAGELHDSVVRHLMEIGFESEAGATAEPAVRHRFDAISHAAQSCLEKIRNHIAEMTAESPDADSRPVEEVLQALRFAGGRRRLHRSFNVGGDAGGRRGLPPEVASALIRGGQEALQNADLHSGGTRVDVDLTLQGGQATLRITDDGDGIPTDSLTGLLDSPGHLGIRHMRSVAHGAGGSLAMSGGERGGLRVEMRIPLTEDKTPGLGD